MNNQINSDTYNACEQAFATELVLSIKACVDQATSLSLPEKNSLISSLAFTVATHLSGSSYSGCVGENEVYPKLGFSLGESSDAVFFGTGSSMHEEILGIIHRECGTP